jgi:hypothetical protein
MKDQSIQSRSNTAPFRLTAMAVLLGVASFGAHAAQTVTLTSNLAAVTVGQSITLTAKANNGLGTALKGPITFTDGANQVPGSPVNAVNSTATLTVSPITSVGVHNFAAAYTFTGLVSSKPVASAVLPVTVNKAVPTVALAALPAATVGSAVDVSAQLGGGYKAGGVVTITDTTANTSAQGTLDASGKATVRMTFATPGTHSLKAAYAGDANNASAVTATAATLTANKASPVVTFSALPAATVGTPVDVSVQLNGGYKPGGTVTISDATPGTTPVQGTLDATGKATVRLTFSTPGTRSLKATYAGDANNVAASSAVATLTAKNALTINLASDTVVRWVGSESVGLTVNFSSPPPAGAVLKFMDSVNGAAPSQVGNVLSVSGKLQDKSTLTLPSVGTHVITAVYAGDALTNAATSGFTKITAVPMPPADAGTSGYSKKVYVDVAAPDCKEGVLCGTQSNPYRNLPKAFATLVPGSELIIAGRDGFAYYPTDDGVVPDVTWQHSLVLATPNYPVAKTVELSDGNGGTYTVVDVAAPSSQPDMSPTLIRKWAGLGRPVVRGTAKVSGWQAVPGAVPFLYATTWKTRAEGLDAFKDQIANVWNYPTVVRPQQIYREPASASGTAVTLEQVGGILYNAVEYVAPNPDVRDPALNPWPEKDVYQRPIGRITPRGAQPWLNLGVNQFYVDAPLDSQQRIDKTKAVTLYVRLPSELAPGEALEVSHQQFLLNTCDLGKGCAANLTIKDVVLERTNGTAYSPQNTAVTFAGQDLVMDNVTIRHGDAICLTMFGQKITVKNSLIEYCGQTGLTASGSGHTIDKNKVLHNNVKGFNESWAAGGMKFISPQGLTQSKVTNNEVAFNDGSGIWLDTTVDNVEISGNYVGLNGRVVSDVDKGQGGIIGFGLHLEAVNGNSVINNTIVGNANTGVYLIGESTTVTGNFIAANLRSGFGRPADLRLPCPSVGSTNNLLTGNYFAWNDEVVRNPIDPNYPTVVQGINFTMMGLMPGDVSDNNSYCSSNLAFAMQPVAKTQQECGLGFGAVSSYGLANWRKASSQDLNSVSGKVVLDPQVVTKVKNRDTDFWATVVSNAFRDQTKASCAPLLKP